MRARLCKTLVAAVTAAVTVLALAVSPAVAAPTTQRFACKYLITGKWPNGFRADLFIYNNGPALSTWTVRWWFADPTQVTSTWYAKITQGPAGSVTATPLAFFLPVDANETFSFGWSAIAATTEVPKLIVVNGFLCDQPTI
ncbi:hypothetical protein GCM10009682_57330 [Luedemannella flava]|uniref:CBM2 domain-containing protein n=1 Tax=Luedemannella flava TaxID=349316 RepID=A0ABN2ML88_9ACTN